LPTLTTSDATLLSRGALDRKRACVREDSMSERLGFGAPIDGLLDRLYARNVAQNESARRAAHDDLAL
jgi:hypothetical protein